MKCCFRNKVFVAIQGVLSVGLITGGIVMISTGVALPIGTAILSLGIGILTPFELSQLFKEKENKNNE